MPTRVSISISLSKRTKIPKLFWRFKNKFLVDIQIKIVNLCDPEDEFAYEESKLGAKIPNNQSINAFLELENLEFNFMRLLKIYYFHCNIFNLKQKADNAIKRLNTIEFNNEETDKMCIICLDRPNDIVLICTHSYCTECIKEWRQFHKSCPLCRGSMNGDFNKNEIDDSLRESTKYELVDIQKNSSQEIEMDNIMKKKNSKTVLNISKQDKVTCKLIFQ